MTLDDEFVHRTRSLFGEERYRRFEKALCEEPVVSVRMNNRKEGACFSGEPVAWAADGLYLAERPVFTADPLFHAGCYYVQEASSMFLGQVISRLVREPVRALDLCAAPGGKTTHLLQTLPEGSLLVSNEPVPLRAQVLAENVIKWGASSVVVTRNEPADFAAFDKFFDLVVVDAPCSGEGMFRKEPFAVEQWSAAVVRQCAERQKKILSDVWGSLRPGGLLIYSTCTFNADENENCAEWIISELGAEPVVVDCDASWGITGSLTREGLPVHRFIPGYTRGEGFFLVVFRKEGGEMPARLRVAKFQSAPAKIKNEVASWVKNVENFDFVMRDDEVLAVPKTTAPAIYAMMNTMRVLHAALPVAVVRNGKVAPQHALAMSCDINKEAFHCVEVEYSQAIAYLRRETLSLPDAPRGFLLLTYKERPIGFVKNIGNRANNQYPAEWRIRNSNL